MILDAEVILGENLADYQKKQNSNYSGLQKSVYQNRIIPATRARKETIVSRQPIRKKSLNW